VTDVVTLSSQLAFVDQYTNVFVQQKLDGVLIGDGQRLSGALLNSVDPLRLVFWGEDALSTETQQRLSVRGIHATLL